MSLDDRDYMRNRNRTKIDHIYNPKEFRSSEPINLNSSISFTRSKSTKGTLLGILVWVIIASVTFKIFENFNSRTAFNQVVVSAPPQNISPPQNPVPSQVTFDPLSVKPSAPERDDIANTATKNSSGVYKCVNDGHVTYGSTPCSSGAAIYKHDSVSEVHTSLIPPVALRRGSNGVYNLAGNINGFPVDFILDTGAAKTTISGTTAYQMGIRSCQITNSISTANGLAGNCSMVVSKLMLGDFNFTNVTVNIAPSMQGNSLIGNDLLAELKVQQHNGEMILSK